MIGININVALKGGMFTTARDATQNVENAIEEERKLATEIFNSQFSVYEGLQNGSNVRSLLERILSSNATTSEHVVKYNDIKIEASKTYKVSFEKGEDGYINNVIITEEQ